MDRLKGKNIIIIGAGQTPGPGLGNGRAAALRFAKEGASLFITAKHLDRAKTTEDMIKAEVPAANVFCYELDSSKEEEVIKAFKEASSRLGPIDGIVNNVGIMMQTDNGLDAMRIEDYQTMMDANLKSAIFVNKHAKSIMNPNGGSIVQTSSIAGAMLGTNLYSLTKAGMTKIGEMFAKIYAKDGIRVNNVILGKVSTPMGVEFNIEKTGLNREEVNKARDASIPLRGGQGSAWDFANAALFLISDEAKFITGANLPVDGGESLGYL